MTRAALLLAGVLAASAVQAAEPVKIGITTILSGPTADRGQSEQYGAQLALNKINETGGVLGRPVEAYYADNACKPDIGVPATKRLIEQEHVPVVIGALCTPVTHAIMPMMQQAKVPLVIATSAGQDFVDASGAGGNGYAFKTIPSEVDIARGLVRYLKSRDVKSSSWYSKISMPRLVGPSHLRNISLIPSALSRNSRPSSKPFTCTAPCLIVHIRTPSDIMQERCT
jgi:branched-chain amino acid transport system substrate-binding protein